MWREEQMVSPTTTSQAKHASFSLGSQNDFPIITTCFGQEYGKTFDCQQQNQGGLSSPWVKEIFLRVFTAPSHVCSKGVELDRAAWQTVLSKLVDGENLGKVPRLTPNWVPLSPSSHLEGGWCAVHSSDWDPTVCFLQIYLKQMCGAGFNLVYFMTMVLEKWPGNTWHGLETSGRHVGTC